MIFGKENTYVSLGTLVSMLTIDTIDQKQNINKTHNDIKFRKEVKWS